MAQPHSDALWMLSQPVLFGSNLSVAAPRFIEDEGWVNWEMISLGNFSLG
jgi:hypothetical protein